MSVEIADAQREVIARMDAESADWQARYDALLEKYHERTAPPRVSYPAPSTLTCQVCREMMPLDQWQAHLCPGPKTAAELQPIDTESPPDVVLAAMRKISPVRDKTYDANWSYWEANKERAAQYPADFAAEILSGN